LDTALVVSRRSRAAMTAIATNTAIAMIIVAPAGIALSGHCGWLNQTAHDQIVVGFARTIF